MVIAYYLITVGKVFPLEYLVYSDEERTKMEYVNVNRSY